MSSVIVGWIALTLVVAIGFAVQDQACTSQTGRDLFTCRLDARLGFRAAIGWLVIGTIALGTVWILTKPRGEARLCPACGSEIRWGIVQCDSCGSDPGAHPMQEPPAASDIPPAAE
ncbi:MAG: hypothetical protein HKN91_09650 [Acidimicrobiia bacterium]|nr:hypothetical protein [Acidimicrobiia bacterium]